MDVLRNFFAEHLDDGGPGAGASEDVVHMTSVARRFVLFRVGPIRFALPSSDIATITRNPDPECEYVSALVIVPRRYRGSVKPAASDDSHVQIAGTRFGFGPCAIEGDALLPESSITLATGGATEAWIRGTLAEPASLVLERERLCEHLVEASRT